MAELRIAVVHYEHKQLDVSRGDDKKGLTIGQQIDKFIGETLKNTMRSNGGPSPISEVNLMLDISEQHMLLDAFLRDGTSELADTKKR